MLCTTASKEANTQFPRSSGPIVYRHLFFNDMGASFIMLKARRVLITVLTAFRVSTWLQKDAKKTRPTFVGVCSFLVASKLNDDEVVERVCHSVKPDLRHVTRHPGRQL